MSPYRQPALRYIVPESLKTPLKRKIKFAWNRVDNMDNPLFGCVIIFTPIVSLLIDQRMKFAIPIMLGSTLLIVLATMLLTWCSFFIQAKQRNKHAKLMDELTQPFKYLPFWNDYTCNSCGKIFQSLEKARIHSTAEHFESAIVNEI